MTTDMKIAVLNEMFEPFPGNIDQIKLHDALIASIQAYDLDLPQTLEQVKTDMTANNNFKEYQDGEMIKELLDSLIEKCNTVDYSEAVKAASV